MKQKITALLQQLNHGLVEREAHLKLTLLTVLTGENIVLVGPPGTGKSMIARRVAKCLEQPDNNPVHFEYLLTKFSTPEEIFGPLSISELKADRFRRNTTGYLPSVKVAFLDEIFKASSSILNALLTILNERIYHNGAIAEKVPLQTLIAASNELPNGQEELAALYDRFLIRSFVDYVSPENLSRLFEPSSAAPESNTLGSADLAEIAQRAESVALPAEIIDAIQQIWQQHKETFKEDRRESLSDRRLKKLINLLRVSAATNDRKEVDLSDVLLLKDCLWNHPDNAESVRNLILHTLKNCSHQTPPIPEEPAAEVIYEVAEDGQTLIPSNTQQSLLSGHIPTMLPVASGKMPGNIVGFRGSGTKADPLLIETAIDLADLNRPEVGQQGYYFKQIADINCSEISTWPDIYFQGHFDGSGYSISNKSEIEISERFIFSKTIDSFFSNLNMQHISIAKEGKKSKFYYCTSDTALSYELENCSLIGCHARMLGFNAENCEIVACWTDSALICGSMSACKVVNCVTTIKEPMNHSLFPRGFFNNGMARTLKNCEIYNYFVSKTGIESGIGMRIRLSFFGLSNDVDSKSSIVSCAIGLVKNASEVSFTQNDKKKYISSRKNVIIDKNITNSKIFDGAKIDSTLFKQRYFEINLGWDFENIWYWDSTVDEPRLRTVGAGNATPQEDFPTGDTITADLLTQQVKANLWL